MKTIKIGVRKASAARVVNAVRYDINIPSEIARELEFKKGDSAKIWVEDNRIIIEKIK